MAMNSGDIRHGWKILTHDFRSPVQGGEPLWDGVTLPHHLPAVMLDTSADDCAAGWNYCASLSDALYIGGLWPNGWPSVGVRVEAGDDAIQRQTKRRSSTLTLITLATEQEIEAAIRYKSACFGAYADEMATEQLAWRAALARPHYNPEAAQSSLQVALAARGLPWTLQRYEAARDVRDTRDAWSVRDTWSAWSARDAWSVRDTWAAWSAWAAWSTRAAWFVRDTWAAWAAWDARDALTTFYSSRMGLISGSADKSTVGIRDAYANGLAATAPTAPGVLGWAMVEERREQP